MKKKKKAPTERRTKTSQKGALACRGKKDSDGGLKEVVQGGGEFFNFFGGGERDCSRGRKEGYRGEGPNTGDERKSCSWRRNDRANEKGPGKKCLNPESSLNPGKKKRNADWKKRVWKKKKNPRKKEGTFPGRKGGKL